MKDKIAINKDLFSRLFVLCKIYKVNMLSFSLSLIRFADFDVTGEILPSIRLQQSRIVRVRRSDIVTRDITAAADAEVIPLIEGEVVQEHVSPVNCRII